MNFFVLALFPEAFSLPFSTGSPIPVRILVMLFVDKHRPRTFDQLVVHADLGARLRAIAASGDLPHVFVYGPSGAGKQTLVRCLLRELYGPGAEKLRVETKPWKIERAERNVEVELTTVSSNHHVEVNPSECGNQDRFVVQEVIKEMAKSRPMDLSASLQFGASAGAAAAAAAAASSAEASHSPGFKVLVVSEVDRLTRDAQYALRRTMEKYSSGCRLIMVGTSASRVADALRSRCLCVRVPAPTEGEVKEVLQHVAKKENLGTIPDKLATKIANCGLPEPKAPMLAERNLRRALLCLEACKAHKFPFEEYQPIVLPDWELYVDEVATTIMHEQSPKSLLTVRRKLYELIINCVPPEIIARRLCLCLASRCRSDDLKAKCVKLACHYEGRLHEGNKPILHLEAFAANFMSELKRWQLAQA